MQPRKLIEKVMNGQYLDLAELSSFVHDLRTAKVSDLEFIALLSAMETRNRLKGLNIEETLYFVKALEIPHPDVNFDILATCGTGGDKIKIINVSTPISVVAASAGVKTLKFGSKGISSNCGSRNIVAEWGINPYESLEKVLAAIETNNIGYYDFSNLITKDCRVGVKMPLHHVGPLAHPINPTFRLIGCTYPELFALYQTILRDLSKRCVITYNPFVDEISIVDDTQVFDLDGQNFRLYSINPKQFGITGVKYEDLTAYETSRENAGHLLNILSGKDTSAKLELIAVNAGAALYVAGKAKSIEGGYDIAKCLLASGAPIKTLKEWVKLSGNMERFESLEAEYVK